MFWIQEQAEEKLAVYRQEAALRRQLPIGVWRARIAQTLRSAAEWLEPSPGPVQKAERSL